MTHHYRLDASAAAIGAHFGADAGQDPWDGGYAVPGRPAPIIAGNARDPAQRSISPALWGVPPPPQGTAPVAHVRNLASPFWIGTLRHPELRCLVPATAFALWAGGAGARRQRWFSIPSQRIFALAGIRRQGEDWPCFAILTTDANRLVARDHPASMPVILHPGDHALWLTGEWRAAAPLVRPFPGQEMTVADRPDGFDSPSSSTFR